MPVETNNFDVIIIGGGPAGMSAAIKCAELGIDAILLERETELGGQLLWTYNPIENYPPFIAKNGRELRDHLLQRVENAGAKYLTNAAVEHVDLKQKIVRLANGDRYSAKSIILGTGVRRRSLNVPGEIELRGRGVLESGLKDREKARDKTVVIVGGGDAAVENACILSEVAKKIVIVHRRDRFTAQRRFVEFATGRQNVEMVFNSVVREIIGEAQVAAVKIKNLISDEDFVLPAEAVLIRIGVVPNSELFVEQLDQDERGFVFTIDTPNTNVSNIYAVGDVANPDDLTTTRATETGTEAVKRTKI